MLTVRVLKVADDEAGLAVEPSLSPETFARPEDPPYRRANTMWVGSPEALELLGLQSGAKATLEQLAAAVAGQHATSGAPVRADDAAFDLTFLPPTSLSWVWAQAKTDLRADLERAAVNAAYSCLQYLTQTRPVIDNIATARGFAAALALHAVGHRRPWANMPPPLLHVHGYLVGVLDESGTLRGPCHPALHEETLTRECGALGRARLAEDLRDLGFEIEAGTGRDGRSFEIAGVPGGLLRAGQSADKGCAGWGRETDRDPWARDNF
ncbi:relaxase domain-containing protein [Streptomyces sp. NPDC001530]|uniref:relaxase domain-containing protein n=1 Tax=Streptomyces sp. NPDC001530 TaxID=3364582 RepID=UPI0036BC9FA5